MKFGVIVFPGSNCDHDCFNAVTTVLGHEAVYVWHRETFLKEVDCVIIPGGFSYGDYLRAGALASRSPIVDSIIKFAKKGGLVVGICNGFQILTETGLLPGALMKNKGLSFICSDVFLRVENNTTPFTLKYDKGEVLSVPIAHMDGNYFVDEVTLRMLNDNGQVVFRYSTYNGEITDAANPNGAMENIAGICNEKGNVLGMMPHPERCSESILGGIDGRDLFESIVQFVS